MPQISISFSEIYEHSRLVEFTKVLEIPVQTALEKDNSRKVPDILTVICPAIGIKLEVVNVKV